MLSRIITLALLSATLGACATQPPKPKGVSLDSRCPQIRMYVENDKVFISKPGLDSERFKRLAFVAARKGDAQNTQIYYEMSRKMAAEEARDYCVQKYYRN